MENRGPEFDFGHVDKASGLSGNSPGDKGRGVFVYRLQRKDSSREGKWVRSTGEEREKNLEDSSIY